jgi:hypothetical protein
MTTLPEFALSTKVVAKASRGCLPVELSEEWVLARTDEPEPAPVRRIGVPCGFGPK